MNRCKPSVPYTPIPNSIKTYVSELNASVYIVQSIERINVPPSILSQTSKSDVKNNLQNVSKVEPEARNNELKVRHQYDTPLLTKNRDSIRASPELYNAQYGA